MAARAGLRTIDQSAEHKCHSCYLLQNRPPTAPAASDNFPPSRCEKMMAAPRRPLPNAETFGGQVSCVPFAQRPKKRPASLSQAGLLLKSLLGHALDDERKRIRCLHSGRVNLFLSRRIMPRLGFLRAIELKQDEALRRRSIEARYFVCTDNIAASKSCNSRGCFVDNGSLEGLRVVNFPQSDDNIGWRLCLGMEARDAGGSNRKTYKHSQSRYYKASHSDLPVLFERGA